MSNELGISDDTITMVSSALGTSIARTLRPKTNDYIRVDEVLAQLPGTMAFKEGVILGFMALLNGVGAISLHNSTLRQTSLNAGYLVSSLGKFLEAGESVTLTENDLAEIAAKFERYRVGQPHVDQDPLNEAVIVNVLVKAKKMRNWKNKEVYLHEYHPEWMQYHLLGVRLRDGELPASAALRAVIEALNVPEDAVELMDPALREINQSAVSFAHGAYTSYHFISFIAMNISTQVDLNALSGGTLHRFRWFTREEIMRGHSDRGEEIMFSTATVLTHLQEFEKKIVSFKSKDVDDAIARARIFNELGTRITYRQVVTSVILIVVGLAAILLARDIQELLTQLVAPSSLLENLANLSNIGSFLVGVAMLLIAAKTLVRTFAD